MKRHLRLARTAAVLAAAVLFIMVISPAYYADAASKEHTVEIRNLEYEPNVLSVAPGDTITWINYDIVPHTVTADDESWDSGLIESNGKWQLVVQEDTFTTYFCRYHPNMKSKLEIIQKHSD